MNKVMELNTEQKKLIDQIASDYGLKKFKIKVEKGSNKGDNFVGVINRVTIEQDEKNIVLIIKSAQQSQALRKIQPTRDFFLREIYIYERVFEEFAAFENDWNIPDRFVAHAKLFGKSDKECDESLVLEDMRQKSFQMWNKTVSMNSYHIEAVLREYAKFHSISLAMRVKKPQRFKELTKVLSDVFVSIEDKTERLTSFMKALMGNAYKAVEGDIAAKQALRKYEECFPEILRDMQNVNSNENAVVTHGDCWCNNILFKYKDENSNKPSEVCIIDWQLSKLGLPTGDLAYFLLANGSKSILDDFEKYIKFYYDVLCQKLKDFSCNPDEIISYENLQQLFSKSCKSIFWLLLMIMKVQLCDSDEAPDLPNDVESGKNMADIANFNLANMDEYYRRIKLLVDFMMKNNMFDS